MNRRKFLRTGSLTTAGMVGLTAASGLVLQACGGSKKQSGKPMPGAPDFNQAPLPYAYQALEPVIDATTMEIHYSRHAAAYTKNMQEAIQAESVKAGSMEALLAGISRYSEKLRNNAGGHYNHESFWRWMTPGGKPLSSNFKSTLERSFGSVNDLKNQFNAAAAQRFGSGWAWLVVDAQKKLVVGSTSNQDNPLMDVAPVKGIPVLGLDVWEHAYYLKYQNKRADYVANWWNIVNWEEAERRYNWAMQQG